MLYSVISPDTTFATMISISSFGAMFTWFMIFITHLYFRKQWDAMGGRKLPVRMIVYPYLTILGAVLLLLVVLSTWYSPDFKATLILGIPRLIITIAYFIWEEVNEEKDLKETNNG